MVPRSTGALASLEFSKRLLREADPDPATGRLQVRVGCGVWGWRGELWGVYAREGGGRR